MWISRIGDELPVWADELQSRGDAWGELVATSLAHAREGDPRLAARLVELEGDLMFPRVAALFEHGGIVPTWQHGALVGLRIHNRNITALPSLLERGAELLRLPAARFLWFLHVDLTPREALVEHSFEARLLHHVYTGRALLDPGLGPRPRTIVLGRPPRHSGHRDPFVVPRHHGFMQYDWIRESVQLTRALFEPARGLCNLFVHSGRIPLAWATGDNGTRMQSFERLAARIRSAPTRRSIDDEVALARALWDGSLRIQIAALECVTELGVDAAAFVPDLALVDRGEATWIERVRRALERLADDPEIVGRVAEGFVADHVATVRWLAAIGALDARARSRVGELFEHVEGLPGWVVHELRMHAPLERTPTWLERLDAWRRPRV